MTCTSCSKSSRVPPAWSAEPPPDHAVEVAGEAGLEQVGSRRLGVQQQVEGVRQRRAAEHPGVVVGDLGDRPDLRPPLGVVLEVEQHRLHPLDRRGDRPACRGRCSARLMAGPVRQVQPAAPSRSSARAACRRTSSWSSCEPVADRRRRARCRRRPRARAAPGRAPAAARGRTARRRRRPAPATSCRVGDLEAHLGRPPVLVGQPGDDRGGRGVVPDVEQSASAPAARPVVGQVVEVVDRLGLRPVEAGEVGAARGGAPARPRPRAARRTASTNGGLAQVVRPARPPARRRAPRCRGAEAGRRRTGPSCRRDGRYGASHDRPPTFPP